MKFKKRTILEKFYLVFTKTNVDNTAFACLKFT